MSEAPSATGRGEAISSSRPGVVPSASGARIVHMREWVKETFGADVIDRALVSVPEQARRDYLEATPISWVPTASEYAVHDAIASVLGTHVDAVVEHQWENNLNYVYWDVIYSGYPLIHNSDQIHAGYFYKPFDTQDGGRVIVDALSRHAGRAQAYRAEALDFLWRFRVDNPAVLSRHAELIAQVMG